MLLKYNRTTLPGNAWIFEPLARTGRVRLRSMLVIPHVLIYTWTPLQVEWDSQSNPQSSIGCGKGTADYAQMPSISEAYVLEGKTREIAPEVYWTVHNSCTESAQLPDDGLKRCLKKVVIQSICAFSVETWLELIFPFILSSKHPQYL